MARTAEEIRHEMSALKALSRGYQAGMNEGGDGFNPHAAELRRLEAEYDAAREAEVMAHMAALQAAEDAEWTREVTAERRADWHAWVRSQGKTIHPALLAAHCQALGYDMLTLVRQVKRHSL